MFRASLSRTVTFTVHTARVPAPHNHSHHNQCRTPYAAVHTLVLLMMGIMMPKTCWDRSLIINIRLVASCWFLSLHPTFMMHGHKSLKHFHVAQCKYSLPTALALSFLIRTQPSDLIGSLKETCTSTVCMPTSSCIRKTVLRKNILDLEKNCMKEFNFVFILFLSGQEVLL